MNLNLTVNEGSCSAPTSTARTKQLRVHFNEVDAGLVSGPFTDAEVNDVARSFAVRNDVKKVVVEDVV